MKARPIWTQSGTGPKFIRSRVNGALNSHTKKLYIRSALNSRIWERQLQKEKEKTVIAGGEAFRSRPFQTTFIACSFWSCPFFFNATVIPVSL